MKLSYSTVDTETVDLTHPLDLFHLPSNNEHQIEKQTLPHLAEQVSRLIGLNETSDTRVRWLYSYSFDDSPTKLLSNHRSVQILCTYTKNFSLNGKLPKLSGEVTSPTVRSPNAREFSRKPSYPASNQGPYPHQPGQRLPSSSSNPRSPAPLLSSQGYPARSGPQHDPSGRSEHSYQIPYREPPPDLPRDMSRDMTRDISRDLPRDMLRDVSRDVSPRGQQLNGHVSELSSPDIPPLFENNVSHLRSSRRGVPPPLDLPPPGQFAAVNVVSPNRYGVQVGLLIN